VILLCSRPTWRARRPVRHHGRAARNRTANAISNAQHNRDAFYGWYVVGVLLVAYVLAFLDRQVISLLIEPMKHDLALNDTQISLLQGLAFALCNGLGAFRSGVWSTPGGA